MTFSPHVGTFEVPRTPRAGNERSRIVKKPGSLRTISVILALVVLLPALFYSMVEVNALSTSEELVADIYRRQLDVVLFSINQYAWDVVNGWAGSLGALVNGTGPSREPLPRALGGFLENHTAVDAVFLSDSAGKGVRVVARNPAGSAAAVRGLTEQLAAEQERIARLVRFNRQEYRKIEPLVEPDTPSGGPRVLLLFVSSDAAGTPVLLGVRINESRFVNEVLAPRLRDAAADEFIVGVIRKSSGERVFMTEDSSAVELKQQRQLWLFPDLVAGIRLRGATIEDVARSRFDRNLYLILLLDAVLIAGVWFVYRSVRREMDFVRMKSDFVSNVSHELRTPLALIRMYAETLEMGRTKTEAKTKEYFATIVRETERLTRLVNNLLNFSRMEAGRKPYVLVDTDLNTVVQSVMATFNDHLVNSGFSPRVTLAEALPVIKADAEALQEALINVIDNAVKYSKHRKYLRVATGAAGGAVFVEVEDHGIGIAHGEQSKIFDTFYRVSGGLVHATRGSGLGLAIAKHIMDAHHGRIDLKSAPGSGSTFTLVFP